MNNDRGLSTPQAPVAADIALRAMLGNLAGASGADFFRRLAEQLALAFDAQYVAIVETLTDGERLRVLGDWHPSVSGLDSEFAGADAPATSVLGGETLHIAENLRAAHPLDQRMARIGAESYLGVPIVDSSGDVLGLIEMARVVSIRNAEPAATILLTMASRVAIEIEREQAEAALRDSEMRYRALIDDSFHLVAELVEERLIYVSAGYTEALGHAPEDILGGSLYDLIHPDDRRGVGAELQAMAVERRAAHFTIRMRCIDGRWRSVECTARAFRASNGEFRTTLFARDITDRLAAEDELRSSETRFRVLIQNLQAGVLLMDCDGTVLVANDVASALLGVPHDELVGGTLYDPAWHFVHEDGTPLSEAERPVRRAATTKQRVRDLIMGVDLPSTGERMWLLVNAQPQFGPDGNVHEVICSFSDVTAQLMAERVLKESEARFRLLAENSQDIVGRYSLDGTCLWVSPSVTEITGWGADEVEGRAPFDFIHPDDLQARRAAFDRFRAAPATATHTFRYRHKDGHYVWLESTTSPARDPETDEVVEVHTTSRDVTARVEAQEKEHRASELMEVTLESVADAIIVSRPGGEVLYWNSNAINALSIPDDIVASRSSEALLQYLSGTVLDSEDLATSVHSAAISVPASVGIWKTKKGNTFEAYMHPIPDTDGGVLRVWSIRNVTEKYAIEEALRQSEDRFRSLAEHSTDLVVGICGPGTIDYVSPNAPVILGYTVESLIGSNAMDLVHPEDLARLFEAFDAGVAASAPVECALRVQHGDGSMRWFELTSSFYNADNGELRAVIAARDVTKWLLAEEGLRESEQRLRAVISNAPLIVSEITAAGTIVLAEGEGLAATALTPGALLGQDYRTLFPDDPQITSAVDRALAGEEFSTTVPFGDRHYQSHLSPVRDEQGTVTGMISVSFDITERVEAEQALRESEETARALLNAPTDGAVLVDDHGMILAYNATAEQRFHEHAEQQGVDAGSFIGACVFDIFSPDLRAQRKERNDEVFANGERRHFEDERNGVWTDVTLDPVRDADGKVVRLAIFSRDITDRKQDEAALKKRSRELEALNDYLEKTSTQLERSQFELREASEQLSDLLEAEQIRAKTDLLTGALNHGAISDVIVETIAAEVSFALAMVDVDGMKTINDTFGHQAGDDVLLAITHAITRGGAVAGRYGGDEFLVALLSADRTEAEAYKAAVEAELREANVIDPESGAHVPVLASVGIALYPEEGATLPELVERADERMYAEKRARQGLGSGLSSSRVLGGERAARMVGELVPLLTSTESLDDKLRLVAHRLSVGAGYAGVSFDVFSDDEPNAGAPAQGASNQNSFAKAPEEAIEAWNEQARSGTGDTGVADLLRETRKALIIDDIETSPYTTEDQRRILLAVGIHAGIVIPLFDGDTMLATMSVGNKDVGGFGLADEQFLSAVAGQVSAIIRMARLVEHQQNATSRLEESRDETVMLLAAAAEAHSQENGAHFENVRDVSEMIAAEMGFGEVELRELGLAAALHDIGKIHVPDALLSSPERVSPNVGAAPGRLEWETLKEHCEHGRNFLARTKSFELAARVAYTHHERHDGAGYPEGLSGDQIPIESAIIAVADSLDAMLAERAYQPGVSLDEAAREIFSCSGTQFHPEVVEAFRRIYERGDLGRWWDSRDEVVAAAA